MLAATAPASPPPVGDTVHTDDRLANRHAQDAGIEQDPAVLFHDDFENGWGKWDHPQHDTAHLFMEDAPGRAHEGTGLLRSTVTATDLEQRRYLSSAAMRTLPRRVDIVYWRFYARLNGIAPNPHHWVRLEAGTEAYDGRGKAGIRPAGDEGFRIALDLGNRNDVRFYVYWHGMRSGRCNDGSTTPGCAGDQGASYFYGNVFRPARQEGIAPDRWTCIEIMAKANTVGSSDGELAVWIDDRLIGHYRPGHPTGTWLRSRFHTGGCKFAACGDPEPFEGFDFRTSEDVRFKRLFLDAYYERDSFARKKSVLEQRGLEVSEEQTIEYDDIVVATERIGCMSGAGENR